MDHQVFEAMQVVLQQEPSSDPSKVSCLDQDLIMMLEVEVLMISSGYLMEPRLYVALVLVQISLGYLQA
jgi:hypothetical protein